ncbi:MAG: hypothetical protein PHZ24_14205, partial [Bacteroidales bacterium]|nr:hypothetical protein [Bacteroidales bacterium]
MKTIFLKSLLVLLPFTMYLSTAFGQSPNSMSYQAVIRNSSDALVTNTQLGMQISILQGSASGTVIYTETQTPTTNANGLVSIEIGGEAGFDGIDWANGIYFIKTETDPNGGTSYTITGVSQLLSVPYALHSKTAESVTGTVTETDPSVTANFDFTDAATGDLLQYNGTKWVKVTPDYISDYTVTETDVITHEAAITVTESQISDLGTYIETETQTISDVAALDNYVNTQLKNVTNPTDEQDAATKAYVDQLLSLFEDNGMVVVDFSV